MTRQIICDDSLSVLTQLPSSYITLVYIDPPFGTGNIQRLQSITTKMGTKTRLGYGGKEYRYRVESSISYRDDMPFEQYLEFLYQRLVEIHRVLKNNGSLYLHLDFHSVHYARLLLDEIFGPDNFLNEIIWAYDYGGRPKDKWPRKHDNILWYAKSKSHIFNIDDIDRIPYMAPGLVGPEKAARGKLPTDTWWMTIVPTNSRERTGYPNQKPVGLAERIIRASSNTGDLVADFFCGSGTVGEACIKTGRDYLLVDNNPLACKIANRRLKLVSSQ